MKLTWFQSLIVIHWSRSEPFGYQQSLQTISEVIDCKNKYLWKKLEPFARNIEEEFYWSQNIFLFITSIDKYDLFLAKNCLLNEDMIDFISNRSIEPEQMFAELFINIKNQQQINSFELFCSQKLICKIQQVLLSSLLFIHRISSWFLYEKYFSNFLRANHSDIPIALFDTKMSFVQRVEVNIWSWTSCLSWKTISLRNFNSHWRLHCSCLLPCC